MWARDNKGGEEGRKEGALPKDNDGMADVSGPRNVCPGNYNMVV